MISSVSGCNASVVYVSSAISLFCPVFPSFFSEHGECHITICIHLTRALVSIKDFSYLNVFSFF